jgi:hypothetical protein
VVVVEPEEEEGGGEEVKQTRKDGGNANREIGVPGKSGSRTRRGTIYRAPTRLGTLGGVV